MDFHSKLQFMIEKEIFPFNMLHIILDKIWMVRFGYDFIDIDYIWSIVYYKDNAMIASKQKAYISISCKLMLLLPANSITRIVNHTVSSWSTRWRITRIWLFNTEIVFTNISMLTIRIPGTFRSASSNSVWLWNQSLLTSFF